MRPANAILPLVIFLAVLCQGCPSNSKPPDSTPAPELPLAHKLVRGCGMDASGPLLTEDPALRLFSARNETAGAVIRLANLPRVAPGVPITLRFAPLVAGENRIEAAQFKVWQILSMPVDTNRAGYVRHTALLATSRSVPRALLPLAMDNGQVSLDSLRDPLKPLDPAGRLVASAEPGLLWLDLAVPATAQPGSYTSTIEVIANGQKLDSIPLNVQVYSFVLPDERHLHMVGRIEWESLESLFPDLFEAVTPQLLSRSAPKYQPIIKLLDQFIALAQEHRTTVVVPRLQPVVKWPANQPPQVDWADFDSITEPWLTGGAFADKVPLGYWPLPRTQFLDRYPVPLQMQYWNAAASHFDARAWVDRAWVEVEKDTPSRATAAESIQLSAQAAQTLTAHPRLRVTLPLEDPQLQFSSPANPALLNPEDNRRLMTAAPGLLFVPTDKVWPTGVPRPAHWLRTDLAGLVPYIGAGGDERDVRLWAWLAFLRQSQVIGWDGALPHRNSPRQLADPNELTWFYPGQWFGIDQPVPTIQLKWLRRAQQDFEYLYLASQRGQRLYALVMARLMIKPIQIQANETPDPTYGLLSGTTDPASWTKALDLLARTIQLHAPDTAVDPQQKAALDSETAMWVGPQDKPLQIARHATWGWSARPGKWVDLRFELDTYNASGQPLEGELEWVSAPKGWEFSPQPVLIGPGQAVNTYQIKQLTMEARVDLERLSAEARKPIQLRFIDALRKTKRSSYLTATVPVAPSDKREGAILIDGTLTDWNEGDDAIHQGPLVLMLDRAAVQQQNMRLAATSSSIFSNWAARNFYVAFKLDGLATESSTVGKNSVDYQLRRAWGEDLCEILIQPIYGGPRSGAPDVGQLVHIVCKPRGQVEITVKPAPRDRKLMGGSAKVLANDNVRFATGIDHAIWRGELAIPWDLINDKAHQGQRPELVRFNFIQYKAATGESSSWAGPIDFGEDESFTGLLYLRELKAPGN